VNASESQRWHAATVDIEQTLKNWIKRLHYTQKRAHGIVELPVGLGMISVLTVAGRYVPLYRPRVNNIQSISTLN